VRVETYPDPPAFLRGLKALQARGLNYRGLHFLALDPHGAIHVALPESFDKAALRVGEKLTLSWPGPPDQRLYHFDSIHMLRDDFYVFNGDRRLAHPGDAIDVGLVVANFLKWGGVSNIFFGCTPHQPGSWLLGGKEVVALHDFGVVEVLPVPSGLLARRIHDHRLYLLTYEDIARTGHLEDWLPVYNSPLGNILLLERRVVRNLLVLSCERGLVEVDLSGLPRVRERARLVVPQRAGQAGEIFAVVGRIDGEAFAVTRGTPRPWGLENLQPAELLCTPAGQLSEMESLILNRAALKERLI
jgi:hypothetical protein